MMMDIYDELEPLVPQESREAFLRVARQLKEYGDHNPELLRIVEAMGFLSLYTAELPKRLNDSLAQAQAQLTSELKAYQTALITALHRANNDFQKEVAALAEAAQSARSLAHQLAFPDADKIKAASENTAQTAQVIASAASTINQRLCALRFWHLVVIAALGIFYFAGGAWFVWRDHRRVQYSIYEHVAARTTTALARIQPESLQQRVRDLKALLDLGLHFSVAQDTNNGDMVLTLEGSNGVTLYYPRYEAGKYYINIIQ
jgi:hypothetical protein